METIGAYEAKTHLAELLDRVSRGERFVITRHGVPVATLQPLETPPRKDLKEVFREMDEFRKTHSLGGLSIRELINEGRRY